VHPNVIEAFRDGRLLEAVSSNRPRDIEYLSSDERLLLDLL
jgi:hypothetical protein